MVVYLGNFPIHRVFYKYWVKPCQVNCSGAVLSIVICVWVVFGSVMEVQLCFSKDIG